MANLGRNRSYGKVKPIVGSTINWGHPLARGLVYCWIFGEKGGGFSYDLVRNVKNTFNGGVTWGPSNSRLNGIFPKFDGTNDSGTASLNLSNTGRITLDFWLNWDAFSDNDDFAYEFTADTNTQAGAFECDPNSGSPTVGKFHAAMRSADTITYLSCDRPTAGVFHHYVITYNISVNPNTIVIYIDSSIGLNSAYSGAQGTSTSTFANSTFNFMSRNNTALFGAGKLGKLSIYNRILSSYEISSLYTSPYQFIQGNRMSRYFFPAAAVGGVTLNQIERRQPRGVMRGLVRGAV